ncbi:MAG: hypothetical protein J5I59_12735 [Saprospiraceae bacterium]|nr:hypothetical protein [Saprospiraceae bacterium]
MKNTLSQLFFLFLTVCIISSSSCEKEQEPDLVPITTSGENTMGFYWDGIPVNKKGKGTFFEPDGVSSGVFSDHKVYILGVGGNPFCEIKIEFYPNESNPLGKNYTISILGQEKGRAELIDDSHLGGIEYYTNEIVNGNLKLLRYDNQIISGTFNIQLQNPETGKIIHLTDGRFDIKQ